MELNGREEKESRDVFSAVILYFWGLGERHETEALLHSLPQKPNG